MPTGSQSPRKWFWQPGITESQACSGLIPAFPEMPSPAAGAQRHKPREWT